MFFLKRWLGSASASGPASGGPDAPLAPACAPGSQRAAPPAPGASPCQRPDQARKCAKLDHILTAVGIPLADARQASAERCKLCVAIGAAEPWDYWERWDRHELWTR